MTSVRATTRYRNIENVDVSGKRVLVRADLNVPIKGTEITDATRIERFLPTLQNLSKRGAKVLLLTHLGRPDGKKNVAYSLAPIANKLHTLLDDISVTFLEDEIGENLIERTHAMRPGNILMLENIRFHPGEEANDPAFTAKLAKLGDIYVNDAFSVSHRAHASTEGLARFLPAYAGPSMIAELEAFERALVDPERPVAAIVGGSKVSTKIPLLSNLVQKMNVLIIGGGMANTFLFAQGHNIGKSLCEPTYQSVVEDIYKQAKQSGCEIILPEEVVVATEFKAHAPNKVVNITDVGKEDIILDVAPNSVIRFVERLQSCKTLLWNGPIGAFETEPFGEGTFSLAHDVAHLTEQGRLVTIAGGGDTVSALNAAKVTDKMTYVSTAGGAFLEWLEGKDLPGVAALAVS